MLFLSLGINKEVVNDNHDELIKLGRNTEFMRDVKEEGALARPKGTARYS